MGIRDLTKRLRIDSREIDAERLIDRFEGLHLAKIGTIAPRQHVKICGEIKRMRIKPRSGIQAIEIVMNDGSGDATVIFSARRHIPGIQHGQCIIIEGGSQERDKVPWMMQYKKTPIAEWLEEFSRRRVDVEFLTTESFPSVTIIRSIRKGH